MTNASAVKHFVARGVVDLTASVSDAPSSPAAWWSVRPWVPLVRAVPAGREACLCEGAGAPALPAGVLGRSVVARVAEVVGLDLTPSWACVYLSGVLSCFPSDLGVPDVMASRNGSWRVSDSNLPDARGRASAVP